MDASLPDKALVWRLSTLAEFGLLGTEQLIPWADEWVMKLDAPPLWLLDLCTAEPGSRVDGFLGMYAFESPREAFDDAEDTDNIVACLFLCYRRKDFSWLDFLSKAGRRLDRDASERKCYEFYLLKIALEQDANPAELEQTQRVHIEREFHESIERMDALLRAFTQ